MLQARDGVLEVSVKVRTAVLLLRLPVRPRVRRYQAAATLARGAAAGDPKAVRAFVQATASPWRADVWRAWLALVPPGPGRWASPLLDASAPPDLLVNAAWTDWLAAHDDRLWTLLEGWGRAATGARPHLRSLSRLALGDGTTAVPSRALAEAAARFDHPIGDRARARLLAHTDPDAVDLLCAAATESPETTAFCLAHHLAPSGLVERAAFFVRTGQHDQHRALDGDGSLLALAYRAADPDVRAHLRTIMAGEGDADLIRVVVTGEHRDRIAEMSDAELDYLGHHLAQHRRWPELLRLVHDLPLAKAAVAAGLLPDDQRTGDDTELLAALTGRPSLSLRKTVDRLPREHLVTHETRGGRLSVSLSPDSSELAMSRLIPPGRAGNRNVLNPAERHEVHLETYRIGPGDSTSRISGVTKFGVHHPVLHLGDEILVSRLVNGEWRLHRDVPHGHAFPPLAGLSPHLRRTSGGAVTLHFDGLAFADRGAARLRHEPIHSFRKMMAGKPVHISSRCKLATLPGARLIAFSDLFDEVHVTTEDGQDVQRIPTEQDTDGGWSVSALSFLDANTLAVHQHQRVGLTIMQRVQMWEFSPDDEPRRTALHEGPIRARWPIEEWEGLSLDPSFADQLVTSGLSSPHFDAVDPGIPWLQGSAREKARFRRFLAMPLGGDMLVTSAGDVHHETLEIHSRHLPTARALLEQPFLHSRPQDLQRARELRSAIADPAVRDALDLLETCLAHRFGGDIALRTGAVTTGGPTDIALARGAGESEGGT